MSDIKYPQTTPSLHRRIPALAATAWAMLIIFCLSAGAEETDSESFRIEPMVVTADKAEKDKQEISANITAIDGFRAQDLGIDTLDDLTALAPNVHFSKIDAHMTQLNYRGIGGMANMNKVWNVNVDGVTVPYVGMDTLLDVERVEFLRGSQGALYGRNTHAGVVNVITRNPGAVFSAEATASVAEFNAQKFTAALGGPAGETVGYRLTVGYNRGDGFMENGYLGTDDGARHEQISGRGKIRITASPESALTLSVMADSYDGDFDVYRPLSMGVSTETFNNEPGLNEGDLFSPTLTWEKTMGGRKLTAITNYSDSHYGILYDQDFTQLDLMAFGYDEDYRTLTQEIRLESDPDREDLSWLAGMFFMSERIDMASDFAFGSDAALSGMMPGMYMRSESQVDSLGGALFGKVTYTALEKMEMSAGLRGDLERREMDWAGSSGIENMMVFPNTECTLDDTWAALLPSASIAWLMPEDRRIYAAISRGYHVGDYAANQVELAVASQPVDPEFTLTYEAGYKGLFQDNRLEFNAAVFYIDWTDMQVSVAEDNVAYYQNAAEAHSYGLELEARWRLVRSLHIFGAFGWLEGEFDRYDNHTSGEDLAGNKIPNANEYSLTLGGVWRGDSGFFTSADIAFMGPKYMDEQNLYRQESYTLVNARVGYEKDRWALYLYGRNLLDETYLVHRASSAGKAGEPLVMGSEMNFYF